MLLVSNNVVGAGLDVNLLKSADIGTPATAGSTVHKEGLVTIMAGGSGIGLASDQFHFAAAQVEGDFDLQVRVASLKNTDLWAKAGLMLRENSSTGARFAGVFTTPSAAGCLFQARETEGGSAVNQGYFPANQPFTWLRLRRSGDTLSGYAGYDGRRWTFLGAKTISLGPEALLGLAVTSHSTNATTAEFRDIGDTRSNLVEQVKVANEPLGPSNRRTAIVISEIMYHPEDRPDQKNLEFVEIYNSQPYFEDISGWKLAGEIDFRFPPGTIIPGGGFLIVAGTPQDLRDVYGLEQVLGPFSGNLANSGGTLQLVGEHNAVYQDITYNDNAPWPLSADGSGHSLVLARPSYGESDPRAWAASRIKGGSPGQPEAVEITSNMRIRINEYLLPGNNGTGGFLELFNASPLEAELSGIRIQGEADGAMFLIPSGTRLAPGSFAQFTWQQIGFVPRAGEQLILETEDGSRVLDLVELQPSVEGRSSGRWPNSNDHLELLGEPTPGASNQRPRAEIVINEIYFNPIDGNNSDEFIELYNANSTEVDLSGWRFDSGINYTFPQGTRISSKGYLVIAKNAMRLRQLHPNLDGTLIVGDFDGQLSNSGERIALSRPIQVRSGGDELETFWVAVTETRFVDGSRWSNWADGGGSTLELIDPRASGSLASNWADSDESRRSTWQTVEFTDTVDNRPASGGGFGGFPGGGGGGNMAGTTDGLQIVLMGEGECLIDNVEVIGPGNTNRVVNGTFEQGTSAWTLSGNHIRTSLETNEGDQSSQSLHLRASNNGDPGANKITTRLSAALRTNQVATLRARVKWLRGWPEILVRLRGNYLEAYGRLNTPAGPGTPGAPNGKLLDNAGPAFGDVSHFPVVPEADEPVVVTARVDDPDGLKTVTLRYRIDPASINQTVTMNDAGTGGDLVAGDGYYSGVIPGAESGKVVAFTIEAVDAASSAKSSLFPSNETKRECLVRFGEGMPSGAFGTYRLWLTQENANTWQNRPNLSNEPIESTFVYGNWRAVYNAGGRYAGSPYHQVFRTINADAHYVFEFPKGERVLNASSFNKVHAPGNSPFDDTTLQREQAVYWMARELGMPNFHRRYVNVYFNGSKRRTLMEDTQVGNDDFVEQFWPDDTEGDLFKMQPWFEFNDGTSQSLSFQQNSWCYIQQYTNRDGSPKTRRYRWNWLVRGADGTANNYTNVFHLTDVSTDFTNPDYAAQVEELVNVDEWFRFFAINHAVGNWDSVGYQNCQNTYSYKPDNGKWELVIWDANICFGNSRSDGPANLPLFMTTDTTLSRWFAAGSPFRRRFLTAYHDLVNGPMQASAITPMLEAKYAAFLEHGVAATAPTPIVTWLTTARNYILSQINRESAPFTVSSVSGTTALTLEGTGPLDMGSLDINGTPVNLVWNTTSNWTATLTLNSATNRLVVSALDRSGAQISNARHEAVIAAPVSLTIRQDAAFLIFDYATTQAGLYRLQSTPTLINPNWQVIAEQEAISGTVRFQVPIGQIPHSFFRVVEP